MRMRLLALFVIAIWSLFNRYVIWFLGLILSLVSDRVRDQLKDRNQDEKSIIELARMRRGFDDCALFFCSSAGEYEQAKPLIERLTKDETTFCHVVFFSTSGAKFVRARNDSISWSLAPFDDIFKWGGIFAALRPSVTFVVRHELWPAFLWMASEWSKIVVINAVVPSMLGRQSRLREKLNLLAKAWLLRFVDMVCVVSIADRQFYLDYLGLVDSQVHVTGDTKYDRVAERVISSRDRSTDLKEIFRRNWKVSGSDVILIGGSVHLPDVELLVDVIKDEQMKRIRLLLVPHDATSTNIAKIFEFVSKQGLSVELFSDLKTSSFKFLDPTPRVIIIDELGRLFDLYAVADVAWVGGAVHDKVHNVLEPSAWGVPICCGLKMSNSQEAIQLLNAGLLEPVGNAHAARDVYLHSLPYLKEKGSKLTSFVQKMTGASQKVLDVSIPRVMVR